MFYRKQLERIVQNMKERREDLSKELLTLPEGVLFVTGVNGHNKYYQRIPKGGNRKKEHRHGITRDVTTTMALVRKIYIEEAIKVLESDIKSLEKMLSSYRNTDEESVMAEFLKEYAELSDGLYFGTQTNKEWADNYTKAEDFYDKGLKHTSIQGVKMRSKNEIYIASRLDHFEIPYRYESAVNHPDVNRMPDFTIRRPRDNKIIYWEHFGKTNDDNYNEGNEGKLLEYQAAGIVPWDNLIISYDTSDGGIDGKLIDALIQGWLL